MKKKKRNYQEVVFAHTFDALFKKLHAESSYMASSLYSASTEKVDVTPLIITQDESAFMRDAMRKAHNLIVSRLSGYLTDTVYPDENDFVIELILPTDRPANIDHLISHEIERMLITYALAVWYEYRHNDATNRQMHACAASLTTLLHDVLLAHKGCKRPENYI